MFSNTCAAVPHPESLTNDVSQGPALRNSQRNVLTWHRWFHFQRCITFPAICILLLIEGRGTNCPGHIQGKSLSLYSQLKMAAYSFTHLSGAALLVLEQNMTFLCRICFVFPSFPLLLKTIHYIKEELLIFLRPNTLILSFKIIQSINPNYSGAECGSWDHFARQGFVFC